MDALAALRAEMMQKKRKIEEVQSTTGKKYVKRSELNQDSTLLNNGRSQSDDQKGMHGTDNVASSQNKSDKQHTTEKELPPMKDICKGLRELGEPIRLFGETDLECYERLKVAEAKANEMGKGMQNDFSAALKRVDDEFLNELAQGGKSDTKSGDVAHQGFIDREELAPSFQQFIVSKDNEFKSAFILKFMKLLCGEWAKELNSRTEADKLSTMGRYKSAIYNQTMQYIKPLFKLLKKSKVGLDILEHLHLIFVQMWNKNYIKAYEQYLQMAIGNAPWPIGAGHVGIHARPGREKTASRYIAHVMNDETQRKYITGLKRLMSKCQDVFPTDPSRCVNFDKC